MDAILPRPPGAIVEEKREGTGTVFRVSVRWTGFSPRLMIGVGVLILIVAVATFVMDETFSYPELAEHTSNLKYAGDVFVFVIMAIAAGALIYHGFGIHRNRTDFVIRAGKLFVTHGPLPIPWIRSVALDTALIEQLYCDIETWSTGQQYVLYRINAVLKDQSRRVLAKYNLSRESVLFVEKTLEKHLGISAKPVVGELQ